MQYWIEEGSAKTRYVKKPGLLQSVEKKGKYASLWHGSFVGPKFGWTDLNYESDRKQDVRQRLRCGADDGLGREFIKIK
jgi:hypothetical protein